MDPTAIPDPNLVPTMSGSTPGLEQPLKAFLSTTDINLQMAQRGNAPIHWPTP